MEENNLINNDNTYNTDMSTSQSTIGGNSITNNTLNKDDLQEVTGEGGVVITTPVVSEDNDIEQQASGTLTPILLILGDGTTTDEEPVLLEEDTIYKAVINSDYESNIPTITFESKATSWCDANYVIAVTELDKNMPVSYDSTNLSVSFTNNDDNKWCRVTFKKPLEVTFEPDLGLNSDNFSDNSKIIVPVISCEENNTGQERNTTITFNIKNFAISHNIKMNVIQNKLEKLKPIMLYYDNGNYKKLVDCPKEFTLTKHNDAITDSSLQVIEQKLLIDNKVTYTYIYSISTGTGIMVGTPKDVYLGYEDTNKIFEEKLSSVMTGLRATLESDVTECSAKLSRADTTGALIKYSLNKCTADRIITFSYKNTPIFKINQTYDNSGSSTTKTYIIYVCSISGTDFAYHNGFALFDTNNPISFAIPAYGNQITDFIPNHNNGQTTYVLMYTEDIMNYPITTIGTLLKNDNLKHLYGHNDLITDSKYENLYLDKIESVNHYENVAFGNGTVSKKIVTIDMDIYVYINQNNGYYLAQTNPFNFNNLESYNHLGVYELRSTI